MSQMTPREIVHELDKHIVGQKNAKRAVAIALRNRWRRMQVDIDLRNEITPKNILMIGPTGVGKTEIARRLSTLAQAPFIKVEATKFTEVGYVGRDVDSIIRDLADYSMKLIREAAIKRVQTKAEEAAEERILDALLTPARETPARTDGFAADPEQQEDSSTRQLFRKRLREGELDDKEIEIALSSPGVGIEIMAPPGMEDMTQQLQGMFQNMNQQPKKSRRLKVANAFKMLTEEEAEKLLNQEDLKAEGITLMEQHGIVFIDELDKVVKRSEHSGDVSREGVQRDLLPLVEGCTVNTKYGMVKTDHILFIASGAFHLSKPSDLIPELQGRMPIRVELKSLGVDEFVRILTEPDASLTRQYRALMATEGVEIDFTKEGVLRIAELAYQVNATTENIGARRLHTIMEKLLDQVSFEAGDKKEGVVIDKNFVDEQLSDLVEDEDLSRFVL